MSYKVIPFRADIRSDEGSGRAAGQLQQLINEHASDGWEFQGLETLVTNVTTPAVPGDNGCFGMGATPGIPERRDNINVYVAVFQRPA